MNTADVRGLLGVFLAGGYLTRQRGPVKSIVKATLCAGPHDRPFLEEKIAEVRQFIPTTASITPRLTPIRESGLRTTVLRFRFSHGSLRTIHNLLYPHGELVGKEVTPAVLELLGARAAAWLWAEGARLGRNGEVVLTHVGSLRDEARLISGWLSMLTGARSELAEGWRRPRLLFKPEDAARIQHQLAPYAPASRIDRFGGMPCKPVS